MENYNTPQSTPSEENVSVVSQEHSDLEIPRGRSSRRSQQPDSSSSYNSKSQIDTVLAKPFPEPTASDEFEEPIVSWVKIDRILKVRRIAPFSG